MLLNDGELDGVRLLSPDVVAFMASDHLPPDIAFSPDMLQIFEPLGIAATPKAAKASGWGSWSVHEGESTRHLASPANSIGKGPGERLSLSIRRKSWLRS